MMYFFFFGLGGIVGVLITLIVKIKKLREREYVKCCWCGKEINIEESLNG